jgi:hypothetical protein
MPYEENNGNVGDIPGSFNEHLGRTMRQVTHQSYSNNSVREGIHSFSSIKLFFLNYVQIKQEPQSDSTAMNKKIK